MLHAPTAVEAFSSENAQLTLGQVIQGTRYRALRKLGEGGMGAVYAAEHVVIERKVALKILHPALVRNPAVLEQFKQEARAASRIGNPYICDVTDWGELPDGRVFFAMEYIEGQSLGDVLKKKARLPIARCIPIWRQVAKALGAAHEKGIVHLDVKPDNVLLTQKDGRADGVKVVDFGVAGLIGGSGGVGKVMGTPEYMAPERTTPRGHDHRSDIYSLGVMAFEMIVGEVPFQGPTPIDTLAMHASDAPDRLNERLVAPVPASIEAFVRALLEKDPAKRPQTMAEVEARLIETQLDAGVRTAWDDLPLPTVGAERTARINRRLTQTARRSKGFLMGGIAGGTAVAAAVLTMAFRHAPERVPAALPPPVIVQTPAPAAQEPAPMAKVEETPGPAAPRPRHGDESGVGSRGSIGGRDSEGSRQASERGFAALAAGQIQRAKTEFEVAVDADPRNASAIGGLAEVAFERARYDDALRMARKATRLSPRNSKYLLLVGDSSFKLARYPDALKAYQRAQALDPSDAEVSARLSRMSARLGQSSGQ